MSSPQDSDTELLAERMNRHGLSSGLGDDPVEVVRTMGALQAQDHGQSLWSVASRMRMPSFDAVRTAAEEHRIVRTWPMRGTVHWVPSADAVWMLGLTSERTIRGAAKRRADLGLTDAIVTQAERVLADALHAAGELSRPEVMALWQSAGIPTTSGRGYHLLWTLAQRARIVIGPLRGKQQTFLLTDDLIPVERRRVPQDPAAELVARYLSSHGPATVQDFAWWAGTTLTVARAAVSAAVGTGSVLAVGDPAAEVYRGADETANDEIPALRLLAGFDEYVLGYTVRDAVLSPKNFADVVPGGNGVFLGTIVVRGRVAGTWRRTVRAKGIDVEIAPFAPRSVPKRALTPELDRYAAAAGLPVTRVEWT